MLIDVTRFFREQGPRPQLDGVLLTQAHRDAAGGIPALRRWWRERAATPLPVYGPSQAIAVLRGRHRRLDALQPDRRQSR